MPEAAVPAESATPVATPAAAPADPPAAAPVENAIEIPAAPAAESETPETPPAEGTPPVELQNPTMPEGVELDSGIQENLMELAKAKGWDQETLQSVAELGLKYQEAQVSEVRETVQRWQDEVRNHPEIGGENLNSNLARINQALQSFGSDELRADLRNSGWGNHPGLIEFLHNVTSVISEDTLVTGKSASTSTPRSPEQRMYPTMKA